MFLYHIDVSLSLSFSPSLPSFLSRINEACPEVGIFKKLFKKDMRILRFLLYLFYLHVKGSGEKQKNEYCCYFYYLQF